MNWGDVARGAAGAVAGAQGAAAPPATAVNTGGDIAQPLTTQIMPGTRYGVPTSAAPAPAYDTIRSALAARLYGGQPRAWY